MSKGCRSDQRGDIEFDKAMAFPGRGIDPGDRAAHGTGAQHHQKISLQCGGIAALSEATQPEQAACVCGQPGGLAQDGGKQGAQAAAQPQANPCGPGAVGVYRILWPGGSICPGLPQAAHRPQRRNQTSRRYKAGDRVIASSSPMAVESCRLIVVW